MGVPPPSAGYLMQALSARSLGGNRDKRMAIKQLMPKLVQLTDPDLRAAATPIKSDGFNQLL